MSHLPNWQEYGAKVGQDKPVKDVTQPLGSYPAVSIEGAQTAAAGLRAQVRPQAVPTPIAAAVSNAIAAPTFGQVAGEWFAHTLPGKRENTVLAHQQYLRSLAGFNDRPMHEISDKEWHRFVLALFADAPSKTNRVLGIAAEIYSFARVPTRYRDFVPVNPLAETEGWLPKVAKTGGFEFIKEPKEFARLATSIMQGTAGAGVTNARVRLYVTQIDGSGSVKASLFLEQ